MDKPTKSSRKVRSEEIISALLEHGNTSKAARALGVSEATVRRRLRTEEFQEEFRRVRREALSQAVARLQQSSTAAAVTLLRIMVDPAAPASTRMRAASCVLDGAMRGMEMEDLEVRLARLEQALTSER
jgi:AcrR family transcriptional regulator